MRCRYHPDVPFDMDHGCHACREFERRMALVPTVIVGAALASCGLVLLLKAAGM